MIESTATSSFSGILPLKHVRSSYAPQHGARRQGKDRARFESLTLEELTLHGLAALKQKVAGLIRLVHGHLGGQRAAWILARRGSGILDLAVELVVPCGERVVGGG